MALQLILLQNLFLVRCTFNRRDDYKGKNAGKKKDNCNKKYFKAAAKIKIVYCHALEFLRQKDLFWDIDYFHYIDYFSFRSIGIDIHPVCFIMRLLVRQEYLPVKNNLSRNAS